MSGEAEPQREPPGEGAPSRVLVIDVGGTNVKVRSNEHEEARRHPSGPGFTPAQMVEVVRELCADWEYDAVSIGFPGPVLAGRPAAEPHNLGEGWVGHDFEASFGKPVRVINDAAMQALGSYEGGRMLFLGLGTGLGSAVVVDGRVEPLELAHLPYRTGETYEDYVGKRGLERLGVKEWSRCVADVATRLREALQMDYVVLGGGHAKQLEELPEGARLGDNAHAFRGGFRLWGLEAG